ncbi:GIY-YIG nuclease family protein, partial [Escherichia coli]|nr:GIY-YIG nuclease family protein [Escherichia coli]
EKIAFLNLEDNSDWESVRQQFLDKVALLEKAQEEKEYQAELKRQMREEKERQDELDRRQREAEEEERRLAEQQKLIEEALRAAEGAHREELEKQRLA